MTINDFSHFAIFDNDIYIYEVPDSADYTIHIVGAELQAEKTLDGDTFSINAELAWGIIYKALEKVAEFNGADKDSVLYFQKSEYWENKWKKNSERKNSNLDQVQPYSLL